MGSNEAFSRVLIDAQLNDQGWNTQETNSVRYEVVLEDGKIGNKPPRAYFADIQAQCSGGPMKYGAITDAATLKANLAANCVPEEFVEMDLAQFDDFLKRRRELMAAKIRIYYQSL